MAAVRLQQKNATRKAILDAAIQVFARLGYDGTNFREITALSGATRQLILYHFQSKEALWQQAAEHVEQQFNDCFDSLHSPDDHREDRDRVRHSLECFIHALCTVPEYGQIYLREGVAEGPRMEWLAHHFAPKGALNMSFKDQALQQRLRTSVLRDILASSLVAFITLGPLLDRSRAVATRQKSAGIYPLSPDNREALVEYLLTLVFK